MESLAFLGRTLGFSFAAGVNLYATVALIGLASRYDWVQLPPEYAVFDNNWIIGIALVLYVVEFFADKIPWVDTLLDTVHTFIRPAGGALMAVAALGDASPGMQALIGVIGGAVAAGSHVTKAGTRVAANTSPEPFSNWALSIGEDIFVVGLGFLTMAYPVVALVVCALLLVAIVMLGATLFKAFRRRFGRTATDAVA
jgi:Domain of unknown function (DUF4126)